MHLFSQSTKQIYVYSIHVKLEFLVVASLTMMCLFFIKLYCQLSTYILTKQAQNHYINCYAAHAL